MHCTPQAYLANHRAAIVIQPNTPGADYTGLFYQMPPAVCDEHYGSLWMGRVDQSTSDANACADYVANRNSGIANPAYNEPAPLVRGLTAEGNPLVFTKTPPPLPASVVGEKIGGELLLGRAILETAESAKVDESLATALTEIKRISATGAEFARRAQDALILRVPEAFATFQGAQSATIAEAQRVLDELMKIKHWRQVLRNKNVLVVLKDGEDLAIVGGKAGILRGHHVVEKSMVDLLKSRWGFTTRKKQE